MTAVPTLFVDDEVFKALRTQARDPWQETPNDVLRRLLNLPASAPPVSKTDDAPGQLGPLIRSGLLTPGQVLTWYRRNLCRIHTATVTAQGWLLLEDGTLRQGPDSAASHYAGHARKGWAHFKTSDGTSLADLAAALPPL